MAEVQKGVASSTRIGLLDMPQQIIEIVGYSVPPRQIATVRRASKDAEQKFRGVFRDVNYEVLTTSLASERSLRRCLAIVQRSEYAATVRRVDIWIDQYDDNKGWKDRERDELEMKRIHLDEKLLIAIFRCLRQDAHGITVRIRSGSGSGLRYCGASLGSRFNSRGLLTPAITDGWPFRTTAAALALSFLKIDHFVLDSFDEQAYSVAIKRVMLGPPQSCPAVLNAKAMFQGLRELRMDIWTRSGGASSALAFVSTMAGSPNLKVLAVWSRDRFDDQIQQPGYFSDYAVGKAICALRFPRVKNLEIRAMLVLRDTVELVRKYDGIETLVLCQATIDVEDFDASVTHATSVAAALNALAPSRVVLTDQNTRFLGEYEDDEEIRYAGSL